MTEEELVEAIVAYLARASRKALDKANATTDERITRDLLIASVALSTAGNDIKNGRYKA